MVASASRGKCVGDNSSNNILSPLFFHCKYQSLWKDHGNITLVTHVSYVTAIIRKSPDTPQAHAKHLV